jgi:uncharacterized protein YcfJ
MDEQKPQGRTNYDWVNGMRVGILAGGIAGLLLGWLTGFVPIVLLLIGAAAGGFIGARTAQRW